MTVRWKPLMILSGLFLVVALIGVVAITVAMMPRSSQGILKVARAAREAGRFEDAEIYYKQALQVEPRNAVDPRGLRRVVSRLDPPGPGRAAAGRSAPSGSSHLRNAVKFDKAPRGPRRELLRDAMDQDLALDSIYWAKELLNVDAGRPRCPLRPGRRGPGGAGAERPGDQAASRGAGEGQGPGGAAALDPGAAGRSGRG